MIPGCLAELVEVLVINWLHNPNHDAPSTSGSYSSSLTVKPKLPNSRLCSTTSFVSSIHDLFESFKSPKWNFTNDLKLLQKKSVIRKNRVLWTIFWGLRTSKTPGRYWDKRHVQSSQKLSLTGTARCATFKKPRFFRKTGRRSSSRFFPATNKKAYKISEMILSYLIQELLSSLKNR